MNNQPKDQQFLWQPQPEAARLVLSLLNHFCQRCQRAESLREELLNRTGTRLVDWVDSICLPESFQFEEATITAACQDAGFDLAVAEQGMNIFAHTKGIFPVICVDGSDRWRVTVKVEDVTRFLLAHQLMDRLIEGSVCSQLRQARVAHLQTDQGDFKLWVAERHGITRADALQASLDPVQREKIEPKLVLERTEKFRLRERVFADDKDGFRHAQTLISQASEDLGTDWACDLFFAAEREYWQSRNHAARTQKLRQDLLGMGWANHDHHTYRCSRQYFANLIETLELLGFQCRERFYAGEQAGWGAQVLEQPACGIVIFADVDLQPGEVEGDFAHQGLSPSDELGTVGLWCALHGEAFLQAGMHHLECQFDFDAARQQLAEVGVATMKPFTDFEILRQAFTEPEVWQVSPKRIESVLKGGWITQQQATRFSDEGVIGSHLEILERNDGYKGFNQTGISHIIKQTDPRAVTNA